MLSIALAFCAVVTSRIQVVVIMFENTYRISGTIEFMGVMFIIILIALTLILLIIELNSWFRKRKAQANFIKNLAKLSMSLEEVLEEAPYEYALFQGEDTYRIYDTRLKNVCVDFACSKKGAEMWIVNRYASEKEELKAP